jgi:YggT family protein
MVSILFVLDCRFPNPPQFISQPLSTVCDPYLNLFRGIIPPLGGTIDLSPILAFITLDLFTNSANALGAEIGHDGQMVRTERRGGMLSQASQAWNRRIQATAARKQQKNSAQHKQ